jgi:short-subunit dehydrogenase
MPIRKPGEGCVWITGASSGIGAKLAERLGDAGHHVAISARSEDELAKLASRHGKGALEPYTLDVTDGKAATQVVEQVEQKHGELHTAVLCAGTYSPIPAGQFDAAEAQRQIAVNLGGVVNCIDPLLERMLKRRAGHIAIVASLTSRFGLPQAGVYGATKAALVNLAEALRVECRGRGVTIQVINPGFVETPLTAQNDFRMPFLVPVEEAADIMAKGLASDRFEIAYPWQMDAATRLLQILPRNLSFRLTRRMVRP